MKNRKHKFKRGGIAERWVFTTFIPSLIAVALAFLTIFFISRQNYYYSAEQAIGFRITAAENNLPSTSLSSRERYRELVKLVQSFSEKDKFEFMLLDRSGNVLVTSGGFAYSLSAGEVDFMDAAGADNGKATYIGKSSGNEHIIAVTTMLNGDFGDAAAIRFVSSLKGIDRQLRSIAEMSLAIGLVLLLIVGVTGFFFVSSIVEPLDEIGNTTKQVAAGELDVRVENRYSGEVGELCAIINDMATELQNSSNLKNDFISSISHEIRTPLTSIKGWGETLRTLRPGEERIRNKGLEIIVSETDRLQLLVEDLLDFSKLEANRTLSLALTDLDLCTEVSNAVLTLEQRASQLGLSVSYSTGCDSAVVTADRNKLRQVFTNIFDNAVKYSPRKGCIYVTLSVSGAYAVVSIRDEGPGIPSEEIEKVTEKYYRASNSVYGTGIGLALVSQIIKAHNGTLTIESELGKGTDVIVGIPLAPETTDNKEGNNQ